jgi:hypothetical protein
VAPVAFHDAVALEQEFAGELLAGRAGPRVAEGEVAAFGGEEPGEGLAATAELVGGVVVGADDGGGFGEAVALVDGEADLLEEDLVFQVEGRAAGDEELEAAAEGAADAAEEERVVDDVVAEDAEQAAVEQRPGGEDAGGVVEGAGEEGLDARIRVLDLLEDAGADGVGDAGDDEDDGGAVGAGWRPSAP